jgi:threonine dehydratase
MLDSLAQAIREASDFRPPEMLRTPLEKSDGLSRLFGCSVLLKCEHLQTTGSFKYRGAANKVRLLSGADRKRGVVTASSGNHGMAVALAGRHAGVPVTVFVSEKASAAKLAAIEAYGAELRSVSGSGLDAELEAKAEAERSSRLFVSPYNDLDVIAGQGTIGLEVVLAEPRVDAVFLSVGGGGLASGIGAALAMMPSAELVGCWPENSPALLRCLEAGVIHDVPETDTISDGTAGGIEPGSVTLEICARVMKRRVTVDESLIKTAMWAIAEHDHWMIEGAAGVALAGLANLREEMRGKTVAVVVCGRNIDANTFSTALQAATPTRLTSNDRAARSRGDSLV